MTTIQKCRVCGCTLENACMTPTGPCYWVEPDLCSAHLVFQGEMMTCVVCGATEQSDPKVKTGWHCIQPDGKSFYACPKEFPADDSGDEAFKVAYLKVVEAIRAKMMADRTFTTDPVPCPSCGHMLDRNMCVSRETGKPHVGSIAICIQCTEVAIVTEGMNLRKAELNDLVKLPGAVRTRIGLAQQAIRRAKGKTL